MTITIKRQQWTYIIRTEPRDTASLLRLGAELEASPGLVVVSYSPYIAAWCFKAMQDGTDLEWVTEVIQKSDYPREDT